jgi:hypothetical protein
LSGSAHSLWIDAFLVCYYFPAKLKACNLFIMLLRVIL